MQRVISDKVIAKMFMCKCGNTEFEQECFTKSIEIVNIEQSGINMQIVSKEMKDIDPINIEYNNSFTCPKCGSIYEIVEKDGIDVICDLTLNEESTNGSEQ